MTDQIRVATDKDLQWLDIPLDADEVARSLQASATAALQASRLPDGYAVVRVEPGDRAA